MISEQDTTHWFVLNFIRHNRTKAATAQSVVDRFNATKDRLRLFAPKIIQPKMVNGVLVHHESPLTFHYVFVNGTLADIKELCRQDNGFSFLLNLSSENRYGIVSDAAMHCFRVIARGYENSLPFYNIKDIDLEEGDLVEVIDGDFAGLKGVFMPRSKSKSGNIMIAANPEYGAMAWNISVNHIRVLEFSKDSKRPYDQIDAFVPKLFHALRKFNAGSRLSEKELAPLVMFCRRMEMVNLNNSKLEAKLSAILVCAQTIIGDMAGSRKSYAKFLRKQNALTNDWTMALVYLLQAIPSGDLQMLKRGWEIISNYEGKDSKSRSELRAEYRYYLDSFNIASNSYHALSAV